MILVACHDAGGAEIVSSYIKKYKKQKYIFCMEGPAIKIFKKKIKNFKNLKKIKNYKKIKKILVGASIKNRLAVKFLNKANKLKIFSVCFLDHWTNYKKKLTLNGKLVLPNEFLVGDIYAKKLARRNFPKKKIKLIKNPYLSEIKFKFLKKNKKINNFIINKKILYLTEPLKNQAKYYHNNYNYYGYNEFSALKNFLNHILKIKKFFSKSLKIKIRLHPSENINKYNKIIKKYKIIKIKLSKKKDLLDDIINNNFIVGCETTALVVALILKKKVFCSIPNGGKKSSLPYKKIMNISKLKDFYEA